MPPSLCLATEPPQRALRRNEKLATAHTDISAERHARLKNGMNFVVLNLSSFFL